MSEGPEWFAPKRYGYGSGVPISWQGWLVTIAYVLFVIVVVARFHERPLQMIGVMALPTTVFVLTCARTTRGGWRWRWGGDVE